MKVQSVAKTTNRGFLQAGARSGETRHRLRSPETSACCSFKPSLPSCRGNCVQGVSTQLVSAPENTKSLWGSYGEACLQPQCTLLLPDITPGTRQINYSGSMYGRSTAAITAVIFILGSTVLPCRS